MITKIHITKEYLNSLGIDTQDFVFGPNFIPYNGKLKDYSKNLRRESTLSEILLWNEIKQKKMGYVFKRQKPLLQYIVDFYCEKLGLVLEIDGCSHDINGAWEKDLKRQSVLESIGLRFLRFDDREIKKDIPNVLRAIEGTIQQIEKELGVKDGDAR
jgi:very-short-patch-repair endonuclease